MATFNETIVCHLEETIEGIQGVRDIIVNGGVPENEDWLKAAAPLNVVINLLLNYSNLKDKEMIEGENFFVPLDKYGQIKDLELFPFEVFKGLEATD